MTLVESGTPSAKTSVATIIVGDGSLVEVVSVARIGIASVEVSVDWRMVEVVSSSGEAVAESVMEGRTISVKVSVAGGLPKEETSVPTEPIAGRVVEIVMPSVEVSLARSVFEDKSGVSAEAVITVDPSAAPKILVGSGVEAAVEDEGSPV